MPPAKTNIIDRSVFDKYLTPADKKTFKAVKFRKPLPKQTEPGSWSESKVFDDKDKPPTPTSPLINPLNDKIAAAFPTGRPFDDRVDTVQCKHCKKPVLPIAAPAHIKECLKKKQEKLQRKKEAKEAKDAALRKERNGGVSPAPSEAGDGGEKRTTGGARKSAAAVVDGESVAKKTGKKRKADDEGKTTVATKKKKKEEPKAKVPKPKGPVDVEKQCGVLLANGSQCARSLTCKSHSMGAKRAVQGRSLPYDVLLHQYQKKNQARQQRAAMDANAPLEDDFEPPGTVDSDEERDAVMSAIHRSLHHNPITGSRLSGTPIVAAPLFSIRNRYKHVRIKDMLANALGGSRGGGLFTTNHAQALGGGLFGTGAMQMPDSASTVGPADGFESRRQSIAPGRPPLPGSRKQSIVGAA
ncbi:SCA7-domain-containing protein [Trichodelitschia bisporula]|uniref:SCA7-domain-containing protein n=1 Tax=Trichodelitschia bisporula TaxID=703511 RepID=A0A6G1HXR8_9PEZI|nr:SCA7-domain-containing protein [Trichodelitschia bisporula]